MVKRKKSGGGSRPLTSSYRAAVDKLNQNVRAEEEAFMAELCLAETPSFLRKLKCKLGFHGEHKREYSNWTIGPNEDVVRHYVHNYRKCFCVSCGHRWSINEMYR